MSRSRNRLQWSHVFSDMVSRDHLRSGDDHRWQLQWSHVFSDMVRSETWARSDTSRLLQWSHVFSDMVRG
ncbi:protein of unknown function [Methanoculleus bourgensis]|uniref:Uncharacterized protein n=1 Tax=Methanoculleus bourgensis TaxID=83986 RepID=A0A0X8XYU4_9EURY|nr:protein of unknown function [Methanoculleus bourgensis]